MIFRALDADGDWRFGAGKASYARFNDAILLNIQTVIKSFLSECFYATDFGIPWFDLINYRNKEIVVLYIKGIISACYGVIEINEIEYTYSLERTFEIKYNINTQYVNNILGTIMI